MSEAVFIITAPLFAVIILAALATKAVFWVIDEVLDYVRRWREK